METIWKYPFPLTDDFTLEMPAGAEILHAEMQDGVPCLWAKVWSDAPKVVRVFCVIGTGAPIDEPLSHIATFPDRVFIWHLFERRLLKGEG